MLRELCRWSGSRSRWAKKRSFSCSAGRLVLRRSAVSAVGGSLLELPRRPLRQYWFSCFQDSVAVYGLAVFPFTVLALVLFFVFAPLRCSRFFWLPDAGRSLLRVMIRFSREVDSSSLSQLFVPLVKSNAVGQNDGGQNDKDIGIMTLHHSAHDWLSFR